MIKRDCIYYDYGRTAPTAYGAWCDNPTVAHAHGREKAVMMTDAMCVGCTEYNEYIHNKVCECCGQKVPREYQYK